MDSIVNKKLSGFSFVKFNYTGHCGSRSRGSTGGLTDSWDEHRK